MCGQNGVTFCHCTKDRTPHVIEMENQPHGEAKPVIVIDDSESSLSEQEDVPAVTMQSNDEYITDEDLFATDESNGELPSLSEQSEDDCPMDTGMAQEDGSYGDGENAGEKEGTSQSLMTGVGFRDYSLLQEVYIDHDKGIEDGLLDSTSTTTNIDTPRETTVWLAPEALLDAVETELSGEGPRLAESGTLAPPSILPSQWSKPLVPFVVGELTAPVPDTEPTWETHTLVCSPHRGRNLLFTTQRCLSAYSPIYRISHPQIHASSLMAMVISTQLDKATCCYVKKPCTIDHHVEDTVVNTATVYTDIMEDINKANSWSYVKRFVDIESFTYTTQVFVHGVYTRQFHQRSKSVHEDITLSYPKIVVPSEGIILSTAMRECFTLPSRGLVKIKQFALVIECHGPRPGRYLQYQLNPLYERMGIVCVCSGDSLHSPCSCAQQYVDTLVRLSVKRDPRVDQPLASLHAATLPKSMSTMAYNMFVLIDELTRGKAGHVKRDTTMRGNNVTLCVESFTNKAAFISHDTKYSFSHQPSMFTEIHLSRILLKTAQDVLNSVAQMCVTVLFMMRYGNPDRNTDTDQKYNGIVKQITDFFPALDIRTLPPAKPRPRSLEDMVYAKCENCGGDRTFVKKGFTSVLTCEECNTNTLKEQFYTKLVIANSGFVQTNLTRPSRGKRSRISKERAANYSSSDTE